MKNERKIFLNCLSLLILLVSCSDILPPENTIESGSSSSASSGEATVYKVNPVVATGRNYVSVPTYNGKLFAEEITDNQFLTFSPEFFQTNSSGSLLEEDTGADNLVVLNTRSISSTPLQSHSNGNWSYPQGSDEFYQVNTFYHVKKLHQHMQKVLAISHELVHLQSPLYIPPATQYNIVSTNSLWPHTLGSNDTVTAYSRCELDSINAYYQAADRSICLGHEEDFQANFYMAQDPSVIYHELGHMYIDIMMNQRNLASDGFSQYTSSVNSQLGSRFYDEAGAIGEGVCDYFSYMMNGRKFIGEWGLQRFLYQGRPMSEDDDLHVSTVSTETGERLSYPQYLYYDPNDTSRNYEDVHYAGQIVSHYLVALTEKIKNNCSVISENVGLGTQGLLSSLYTNMKKELRQMSSFSQSEAEQHAYATTLVMLVLNETFAEIGDLRSYASDILDPDGGGAPGSNSGVYWTNLNPSYSYEWAQIVNPPNFRRFFQIFTKNLRHHLSLNLCPAMSTDTNEQLLDEYGLLLFKDYRENISSTDGSQLYTDYSGNSVFSSKTFDPISTSEQVSELNRQYTTLVSKDFIDLPDSGSIGFVVDSQSTMRSLINGLTYEGNPVEISSGLAGVDYNNSNVSISPGEVVALSVNLFNSSNSTMGGVHLLANDWDHMKLEDSSKTYVQKNINEQVHSSDLANWKPCQFDGFPTEGQGAQVDSVSTAGNCTYITRDNNKFDSTADESTYDIDSPQPVCLAEFADEDNGAQWVSQDYFRQQIGLEDHECLNNETMVGNLFNPNECLVRFLPGANHAFFGKIDPQETWPETLKGNLSQTPTLNSSTALILEVNKWVPPGTKFNCRLRARFNNCSDCFNAPDTGLDYDDYEYAGATPFKIIDFQFTVIN